MKELNKMTKDELIKMVEELKKGNKKDSIDGDREKLIKRVNELANSCEAMICCTNEGCVCAGKGIDILTALAAIIANMREHFNDTQIKTAIETGFEEKENSLSKIIEEIQEMLED